jgi:sortase B
MCLIDPKRGANLKYKGKPIIPAMMITLTLTIYFICIFISSKWYVQQLKIKYLANDIKESTKMLEGERTSNTDNSNEEIIAATTENDASKYKNISYLSVDFTDLLKKNSETVGWIKVNNTNVNYSVVQHNDNDFYLKHDFNQNVNYNGWVYGDYRDNFEHFGTNTIIYAHNMTNRTMFGSLVWVLKESWYKNTENHYIKVSTPTTNTIWKIFSIYTIKPEVYYLKTYFDTKEEHQEFLDIIKGRSIYNFNEQLTPDNKVLTLSTCTDDGTKRIVIHAKLIKAEYK